MKVINYVHIQNMYAHKDTKLEFTDGKNYIIGPIGSGKTEVLQAIGFAFFGTCALRDKATSYKNIYVELSFNYKGEVFLIKRKINDASLLVLDKASNKFEEIVNSTSIVNQKIIALLGYNYDIFLLSNFCQQKKLSYFSELTPAKRLQYIDKISGIEEARDLLKYLVSKRKTLKDNISLLKDVTIEPKISKDIDLEFDYELHINALNSKLKNVSTLYSEYEYLQSKLVKMTPPVLSLDKKLETFIGISSKQFDIFKQYIMDLKVVENNLQILKNKLRDIPKLNPLYKDYTLQKVNEDILLYQKQLITSVSKDITIVCSVCNTSHTLEKLIDTPVVSTIPLNIKELYKVQEYFLSGYEEIRKELERDQCTLEKEYETLLNNSDYSFINTYSQNQLLLEVDKANKEYSKFQEALSLFNNHIAEQEVYKSEVEKVKIRIDETIKNQGKDTELKDMYIRHNAERSMFLEQMSLYLQAKDKLSKFTIELNLVNSLIKEITSITQHIKNQTIPLINHHSSYFLNLITKGSMNNISITEDYDLIVDGYKISVRSGGQQDLSSLAFRLSLSQSIISGMLPLFIADEIDSSGTDDTSNDIIEALDTISNNGFQIIMVTHKDTSNLQNVNIIKL